MHISCVDTRQLYSDTHYNHVWMMGGGAYHTVILDCGNWCELKPKRLQYVKILTKAQRVWVYRASNCVYQNCKVYKDFTISVGGVKDFTQVVHLSWEIPVVTFNHGVLTHNGSLSVLRTRRMICWSRSFRSTSTSQSRWWSTTLSPGPPEVSHVTSMS